MAMPSPSASGLSVTRRCLPFAPLPFVEIPRASLTKLAMPLGWLVLGRRPYARCRFFRARPTITMAPRQSSRADEGSGTTTVGLHATVPL